MVRNLLPLLIVARDLHMWPVTRPAVQVGISAVVCFGLVDVVVAAADLPAGADLALLALGALLYLTGIWSWRRRLGLEVFRTALRRRSAPRQAQLVPEG